MVTPGRRDEIIDAALALSEEVGVDRLSMRMIGDRLGTSAMAIYRHLPNKDAVLDALVGRILSEVPAADPDADWKDQLRTVADGLYAVADRHPTVFPMVLHRSYVSEDAIAVMQQMYRILRQADIPTDALPRVERMISTALLGFVVTATSGGFWATDPPASSDGWPRPGDLQHRLSHGSRRWRDELAADVDDLVLLIRAIAAHEARRGP